MGVETLTKGPTPKQAEALRLIAAGSVHMANHGHGAWRISGAHPTIVGNLVSRKLARWPKGSIGEQTCEITDAGRAALAALATGEA